MQQKWMYLEVIFVAGDIANQLPVEAKRFQKLDAGFRKVSGWGEQFFMCSEKFSPWIDQIREFEVFECSLQAMTVS